MNKIKELYNKTKNWVSEHKKIVIGSIIGVTAAGIGIALSNKKKNDNEEYLEEPDYGRDCVMRFVVNDDSQEVLGEVPCTELYAKENIEDYEAFKND